MKIVVNDIAASTTGALSILKDFYRYIRENDTENKWIFLLGDAYIEETERIHVRVCSDIKKSWFSRLKFDLFSGAAYIRALQPDVVFSLQNTLTRTYRGKQVLYVHQPLGFQKIKKFSFFKAEEREYAIYQYLISAMIDSSIKHADACIVQTEWMRKAVIEKTHVKPERVVKILPDVEAFPIKAMNKETELKTNHFFFPSGDIIYKNHDCIIKAVKLLQEKGITDFEVVFTLTEEEAGAGKNNKNIRYRGRMTREEVYDYYRSHILLFPSYIETFGYPPAEAREVGTVIFASDCPFCHEVLDGYEDAYYFHPFHAAELAGLMEQAINGAIVKKTDSKAAGKMTAAAEKESSWALVLKTILETGNKE